jgi:hypothetical protein
MASASRSSAALEALPAGETRGTDADQGNAVPPAQRGHPPPQAQCAVPAGVLGNAEGARPCVAIAVGVFAPV